MITTNISEKLFNIASQSNDKVIIFSAFIKLSKFDEYNSITNKISNRVLLLRGRKQDFIKGSSDIEVIQIALLSGWKVYINKREHAKLYCFDDKKALIGSANLTQSGISDGSRGNIELVAEIKIERDDVKKINNILENSTLIAENELNEMQLYLNSSSETEKEEIENSMWSFEKEKKVESLFPEELLQDYSYPLSTINASILNVDSKASLSQVQTAFKMTNEYIWLVEKLKKSEDNSMSFGEISYYLHNSLISNDRIYRADVKKYVQNLITWLEKISNLNITINESNHSTILKYVPELSY